MILDGRDRFYQWDLDRKLIVTDESIDEVHFCNRTDDCSLVCEVYQEGELRLVDVPNILLQKDWRINVYAFDGSYTKVHEVYEVERRTKPADYIYTETEIKNYDDLAARVAQIEENGISDEAIETAVERYLDENDIKVDLTGYATETYVNEKIETIELTPGPAGKDGKDGEDYVLTEADKKEIAGMVEVTGGGSGDVDLTGYATEEYVDSKWVGYPDKLDVATKAYVETNITNRGYMTSTQVDAKIAAIEHPTPDLTGYATESYVDDKVGAIEIPEVPSLDGYATEKYVDDAIAAIDIPSGGGGSGEGVEEVHVGTEAPDDANIKIWVDTDEESNYPNRDEIKEIAVEVFPNGMKSALNDVPNIDNRYSEGATWRNKFFFVKRIEVGDTASIAEAVQHTAVDCMDDKDMAIRRLKEGFIVYNSNGNWKTQWFINASDVGCISCAKYNNDTLTYATQQLYLSSATKYAFIYGMYLVYCDSIDSQFIRFFNRFIYDNSKSKLAATDMQAAIDELATSNSVAIDNKRIVKDDSGNLTTALPHFNVELNVTPAYDYGTLSKEISASGDYWYISLPQPTSYTGFAGHDVLYLKLEANTGEVMWSKCTYNSGANKYLVGYDTNEPLVAIEKWGSSLSDCLIRKDYFAEGDVIVSAGVYTSLPFIEDATKISSDCVVLTSPNGTMYQLSVADDGTLTTKLFS